MLVTGASGFVGREVQRQLLREGWQVVAVTREPRPTAVPRGVIHVTGDVTGSGWLSWAKGCSAAIHLVGIIREQPRRGVTFQRLHTELTLHMLRVCTELEIGRFVQMSALGSRPNAATPYHHTKWLSEEAVRSSGLTWTIFRPSLVFGPGDGFTTALARALRWSAVFPVFGDGSYQLQPIAVEEVARSIVASLELPNTAGQTYELGGPEQLSFNEVLRRISRALGLRRAFLHVPLALARPMVNLLQHFTHALITTDQLTMLLEGSTCDIATSSLTFSVPQVRFQGPTWMAPPTPAPRESQPPERPANASTATTGPSREPLG